MTTAVDRTGDHKGCAGSVVELYDSVELTMNLSEEGLTTGSMGTVVHVFHQPNLAYEVEFADDEGRTVAMVPLTPDQVRPRS